uniref:Zinc finger protein CONSTANS-LIKE 5 n=1 Tax=Lagerstroemia indica TaxID=141186 RepID=A0A068L885_9MYRT|nr:zinc finger protein CONSTANS-LIKE 5 [Lagerstroemia indica]
MAGRSARACDNCVRKRARWYCAADDAFLCQSCDSSVHSANTLARRHERVRLKTASINSRTFDDDDEMKISVSVPTWDQGFTRKPRTPRHKKHGKLLNPLHLVPEMCSEEHSHEENDEVQLLYRVPVFDPFEVAVNPIRNDDAENSNPFGSESKAATSIYYKMDEGVLPSELDLAEFAADVESLLGKGLEDESFYMEELGLVDCHDYEKESKDCCLMSGRMVKVEDEEIGDVEDKNQVFELNFDLTCEEMEEEEYKPRNILEMKQDDFRSNFLKLDYEGVMSSWDDRKSPWTTGERPEFNSADCWPDSLVSASGAMQAYGGMAMVSGDARGREARVMRYREKRRTRLFSKKIRYEVRKLNAEKRPRMKGRFVKRACLVAP